MIENEIPRSGGTALEERKRDMRPEFLLFVCVALGVTGQLLLKIATSHGGVQPGAGLPFAETLLQLFRTPSALLFVLAGLACYVVSTFLWLFILSRKELSWAYPILASGYVLVVLASWVFFHDHMTLMRIGGLALICAGVVLVFRS